ncbi:MAG: Gfo/Idh/MocA family protein, partial [Bythopirellula sp.]
MNTELRVAVIGLGRMGRFHARHVLELACKDQGSVLAAVVDPDPSKTDSFCRETETEFGPIRACRDVSELIENQLADVAIICSSADSHHSTAQDLIGAGYRVLLEKPLTEQLATDRSFTNYLNQNAPDALMLAFQRRFDEPLLQAKKLLAENKIGRPLKFISFLEDSGPLQDGFVSPGLLLDMSVHNIDEILWLCGKVPQKVTCVGSRLHNHKISSVEEDFDNASMHLSFEEDLVAQIEVSRVHVAGYHVETCIYGAEGLIRVGSFQGDPHNVSVELFGRQGLISKQDFRMPSYESGDPDFMTRFGPAYKAELAYFLQQCRSDRPFEVGQNEGLRAGEIAAAGMAAMNAGRFQSIALQLPLRQHTTKRYIFS